MRHLNLRVKSELDRVAQVRRHRHANPAALAEASLFGTAAIFTAAHGIDRFAPLLVHLAGVVSEEGHSVAQDLREVPPAIWDAWDRLCDDYDAMTGGTEA